MAESDPAALSWKFVLSSVAADEGRGLGIPATKWTIREEKFVEDIIEGWKDLFAFDRVKA